MQAGAEWVGLDRNGHQLVWKKFSFLAFSALVAEARACLEVVKWCVQHDVKVVIIDRLITVSSAVEK